MTDVGPESLDLLTIDEVASRLRISAKGVRRLITAWRNNQPAGLEAVKVGGLVRVAPEAVIDYKRRLRGVPAQPPPADSDGWDALDGPIEEAAQ